MRRIDIPTIAGVLLGLLGLALVLDTGITTALGLSAETTTIVAAMALVGAVLTLRLTVAITQSRSEPPTTETKAALPVPGAEVDDKLAEIDAAPLETLDQRDDLRDRLTTIAASQFTDQFGVRETVAKDSLGAGTWTDDPHAAAFFTGEYPDWAPLRFQIRDRSTFTRTRPSIQAQHVVSELVAVKDGEFEQLHRAPHPAPDEADSTAGDNDDTVTMADDGTTPEGGSSPEVRG